MVILALSDRETRTNDGSDLEVLYGPELSDLSELSGWLLPRPSFYLVIKTANLRSQFIWSVNFSANVNTESE